MKTKECGGKSNLWQNAVPEIVGQQLRKPYFMNPIDDIPYGKGPGENLFFLILVDRQQSLGVGSPEAIQLMYNFPG